MTHLKVLQIGMGPLGIKIADFIHERTGITTISAVDTNPNLIGKTLNNLQESLAKNVTIVGSISEAIQNHQPDVAILSTVSDMERVTPQVLKIIAHGIPVVSTCEELSYPWDYAPELATQIDQAARKNEVAVLGTGVNPGFLMDALPTFLTSVCQDVEKVEVTRVQNATARRIPFQKKIGAGLSMNEFQERKNNGTLRHVGLAQSMQFVASRLGWKLDSVEDIIAPVVAQSDISTPHFNIPKGNATGVLQTGKGYIDGEQKITLNFLAAVEEKESYDEIKITGVPNINSKIYGGVNGDIATCAITINASATLLNAKPGLRTMADVPIPSFFKTMKTIN